jgi:hypothetical protein
MKRGDHVNYISPFRSGTYDAVVTVEISHDEREQASAAIGNCLDRTGAMRWWKPLDGPAVLQAEWIAGVTGSRVWIDVPTITEIAE